MPSSYIQSNCSNISETVKSNRIYEMVIPYKKVQQGVVQGTGIPNSKPTRCCHCIFSHSPRNNMCSRVTKNRHEKYSGFYLISGCFFLNPPILFLLISLKLIPVDVLITRIQLKWCQNRTFYDF